MQNYEKNLRFEIERAIVKGYTTFLCGMALGFDMICAETVLELKQRYSHIKIIGAIPCRDQYSLWSAAYKARYRYLLTQLDGMRCKYDEYNGAECILERNRFMVDNSSLMIALFNGLPGGTKSTIDYAKMQGLELIIIKP